MDEVFDSTHESVIPYLVHFSTKGIVPRVLRVEGGFIAMAYIPGKRLWDMFQCSRKDELEVIYSKLGRNIAYINKFKVYHGDLHMGNVVVNRNPIIIDWETALIRSPDDRADFLFSTGEQLAHACRLDLLEPLENCFKRAYETEIGIPRRISDEEIRNAASRLIVNNLA